MPVFPWFYKGFLVSGSLHGSPFYIIIGVGIFRPQNRKVFKCSRLVLIWPFGKRLKIRGWNAAKFYISLHLFFCLKVKNMVYYKGREPWKTTKTAWPNTDYMIHKECHSDYFDFEMIHAFLTLLNAECTKCRFIFCLFLYVV